MRSRAVLVLLALAACRGDPIYDFGTLGTAPAPGPSASRAPDVGRFVSRLYADVLGRRPGTLEVTIDCVAFDALFPGFRNANCGGQAEITFGLDERETLEGALLSVADPAALWPHLIGVFLAGTGVDLPTPAEVRGIEGAFVDDVFRRTLDRDPSPYERFELVRALREDPAMTPRALVTGVLSSEEYRGR
jgi:hypothetical protein